MTKQQKSFIDKLSQIALDYEEKGSLSEALDRTMEAAIFKSNAAVVRRIAICFGESVMENSDD